MRPRVTVCRAFEHRGVGVHSGAPCRARVAPSAYGSGLLLAAHGGLTPVSAAACARGGGATVLNVGGGTVGMVEHLLAALVGAGVTDARITVEGPEVPILDGSALPWCDALRDVGLEGGPLGPELVLTRAVEVRHGQSVARALPAEHPLVAVSVDFGSPPLPRGTAQATLGDLERFATEVGFARTFALARDVEALRAAGRGRGATLDNTVVYGEQGVENPGGARSADEAVRHKLLDAVGDLALLGTPFRARVEVERGGHALHHQLVRAVLADRDAWTLD